MLIPCSNDYDNDNDNKTNTAIKREQENEIQNCNRCHALL